MPPPEQLCRGQSPLRAHPAAFGRHRVKAPPAKRVAPGDAPGGEQQALDAAMGLDGFYAILAAGGGKAAVAMSTMCGQLGALKKDGLMEKLRILKRKPLLGRGLRALLIHKGTKHYSMRKSNPTRFESFVNS